MKELIDSLLAIAEEEVGQTEEGINAGARIVEYQGATWLPPGPWPWCAAFTAWVLREWLEKDEVRAAVGEYFDRPKLTLAQVERVRCRDARAFGWESWAQQWKLQLLDESQLARRGDFVTFDFSHIGIVRADQRPGQAVQTIEGNTNAAGSRDSLSGDGVMRKTRAPSLVQRYIRIFR